LLDGARAALAALSDEEPGADTLTARAIQALDDVQRFDAELGNVAEVLRTALTQIEDAAHTLTGYLNHREPDPDRLAELDARLATWVSLARRYRRTPAELPALLAGWKAELKALDAAADLDGLEQAAAAAEKTWRAAAQAVSACARRPRRAWRRP
jgi:DNA repair protein RecN (Recombination protein N)